MGRPQASLPALLGQRLREVREARGLTQEELGERAGFTGKYISEVERGLRDLPLSTLRAISHAAGASLDDLFHGVESGLKLPLRDPAEPVEPFSREVLAILKALTHLPPARRRKVLAALRAMVDLAVD